MKAVIAREPGGPEVLQLVERPLPALQAGDVLIRVTAAGVNRPDLMQRNGAPIPSDTTDVLGLEAAGIVVAVGKGVDEFAIGDRVMALLNGGGYAEYCVAQAAGARVIATAGGAQKVAMLHALGVWRTVDRHVEDFVDVVNDCTEGRGVDVVLDNVGGPYVARNLAAMAMGGRHVSLSFLQGAHIELDLQVLMRKNLSLTSSTLRPKSHAEKARLAVCIRSRFLPWLAARVVRPQMHAQLPLAQAAEAHRLLEANANVGKVVLTVAE